MRKNKEKVIIVGTYPPPIGGVSMHIQRLSQYLDKAGLNHICIDISGFVDKRKNLSHVLQRSWKRALLYLFLCKGSRIIHFHNFSLKNIFFYFLLSLRHTVILSFHNERFLDVFPRHRGILSKISILMMNSISYIVVDNNECVTLAGTIIKKRNKIIMIPEFIPPSEVRSIKNRTISEFRKKHQYLLSSNAFQISFYNDQDLYGLDILVKLIGKLVNESKMDVGLVFLLPNIGDEQYLNYINEQINHLNINEYFLIVTEPVFEATALWKMSEAVIRATNTDGNSLTVVEALSLCVPVIASDCTERPEGVVLFKTRDIDDLYKKVTQVLLDQPYYRKRIEGIRYDNNAVKFLELYQTISKCRHGE
jgi:glycosyltransferase involved in cell wall biosynthesis